MANPEITGCRLSARADADLSEIWLYTANRWSVSQADDYIDSFDETLERIVDFPYLSRERTEFSPPFRVTLHRSHLIFYRIEPPNIQVDRILHGRRNWSTILSGDDRP